MSLLRRERALTATVSLVVLGMVIGILATAGQSSAAQRSILARIDTPSARLIVITDTNGGAGLTSKTVNAVQAVSGIDWVLGLGPAVDVRNSLVPGGDPVPMRTIVGDTDSALGLEFGQLLPGSALASVAGARRLGLSQGVGATSTVDQGEYVIAGTFDPPPWLGLLGESVLRPATESDNAVNRILVLAPRVTDLPILLDALRGVVVPEDPRSMSIEGPAILADLQRVVSGDLARYTYAIVLGVLGLGAFATAVTLIGLLAMRSTDFGRRRALGASRAQILGITLLHVLLAAALGAAVGVGVGLLVLHQLVGQLPGTGFVLGTVGLAVLAAVLAAALPAWLAALKDPVAALRTP